MKTQVLFSRTKTSSGAVLMKMWDLAQEVALKKAQEVALKKAREVALKKAREEDRRKRQQERVRFYLD